MIIIKKKRKKDAHRLTYKCSLVVFFFTLFFIYTFALRTLATSPIILYDQTLQHKLVF